MSRVLLLVAAATFPLTTAGAASADDTAASASRLASAEVRAVLPAPGKSDLASATLVGRSGQLYRPAPAGGWKREGRGGVACRVTAAMRAGGQVWALCARAPLFRHVGGIWSAAPLANRGRTRPARISKAPLFSVGRHLYAWRGSSWQRVGSAPSRITELLAQTATRGLAITSRKELLRVSGKSWKTLIDAPKRRRRGNSEVDSPTRLFGSAKYAYAVLASGAIVAVTSSGVQPVTLPPGISSYGVGGFCTGPLGDVVTIGRARRGATSEVAVLSWKGRAATTAGAAPVLADDEHIGILHCQGKQLLLSTDRGRVFLRDESGAWSAKPLHAAPPPESKKFPAGVAPAKSR